MRKTEIADKFHHIAYDVLGTIKKKNIAVAQNTKWIHTESTIGLPSAAEFYWFLNAKLRWIPQMNGFKIPIWETAQ